VTGSYLPLALSALRLQQPVPVDVWSAHGVLLLSKGQGIGSVDQLRKLALHRPMVREADFESLEPEARQQLLRAGVRTPQITGLPPVAIRPSQALPGLDEPASAWLDLHARLMTLLYNGSEAEDFLPRLQGIEALAQALTETRTDESLFTLVQMLLDRQTAYSAAHALLSATICELIAPSTEIPPAAQASLWRAALTMNIGMSRLHDQLSVQKQPPDEFQRREIAQHPVFGADLLRRLDVRDPIWLGLVHDHHETPDGQGYPAGKTELGTDQRLLHLADLFCARISPRRSRRGLAPNEAVRTLYLNEQEHDSPLGALLVKQLGLYPPGSYVRLATQEVAVVVRRGAKVNTPLVLAIVNPQGMPLSLPALRDTERTPYAVRDIVNADDVKVRLDAARVFRRI
jgi:HD-GYP domain-containing protein (c-di-GMP phosphodiesterase class II)